MSEAVFSPEPVVTDASLAPVFIGDLRPGSVQAGFPSPAEDHLVQRVDLMAELIKHPQASYLLRIRGDSMTGVGIFDGDVVLVDRAISPRSGHVVVAVVENEFVCKTLQMRAGRIKLKAANPSFIATLALHCGWQVLRQARSELNTEEVHHDHAH